MIMEDYFQDFCANSSFFDKDLFWNGSYPQFTDCFLDTAVVWTPCAFLWLVLPLYIHVLNNSQLSPFSTSRLYCTKLTLCLLLAASSVAGLVTRYLYNDDVTDDVISPANYTGRIIQMITFLLVATVIRQEKRSGFITSGILFIFWGLSTLTGMITVYSQIINIDSMQSVFNIVPCLTIYGMVVTQFVLTFFAEKPNLDIYKVIGKKPCPEMTASFPSKMTYSWIQPLIHKVYKTGEIEKNFWDLNPDDRSTTLDPTFQQNWAEEMKKYRQRCKDSPHGQVDDDVLILDNELSDKKNKKAKKNINDNKPIVRGPSLLKVLMKVSGRTVLQAWANKFCYDVLQLTTPIVLKMLIDHVELRNAGDPSVYDWQGYMYAGMMFLSAILLSNFGTQNHRLNHQAGMKLNSALVTAIYRKMLTISHEARSKCTVGEIVNLMSEDASHLRGICGFLWVFWSAPFLLISSLVLLWQELGLASLASLSIFVLMLPLNSYIATNMRSLHLKQMALKDERIKVMTEVLNGIKVMKLYAWEESFEKMVMDIREKEIKVFMKKIYLVGVHVFVWVAAPILVCVAVFYAYISLDENNHLDGQKAFVALALFEILSQSINFLPHAYNTYTQANVSMGRIGAFLRASEIDPNNVEVMDTPNVTISVEDATFSWGKHLKPCLKDINIEVPTGGLVAVVGTVGAGKSSLLSALLGEIEKRSGRVRMKGSTVYVPQQAWIQNLTLKDNILFGQNMEDRKYKQVIEGCALKADLDLLKGGDMTEIGEKGINLSGGQKQRVNLARAVYNNADVYLLDDPLSAVDSHVGRHIFDKVIGPQGLLRNKTRVLVTQGVHWLPHVDTIIVIKDGTVSEVGSYRQLLDHDGAFAQYLKTYLEDSHSGDDSDEEVQKLKVQFHKDEETHMTEQRDHVDNDGDDSDDSDHVDISDEDNPLVKTSATSNGIRRPIISRSISMFDCVGTDQPIENNGSMYLTKLIEEEKLETGRVSIDVFKTYIRSVGYWTSLVITLIYLVFKLTELGSTIQLASWTDDENLKNTSHGNGSEHRDINFQHLTKYAFFGICQSITVVLFMTLSDIWMIKAACTLHNNMLKNVLKMPMAFFDTTPLGRIVNRFSKDISSVDMHVKNCIRSVMNRVLDFFTVVIGISYTSPVFVLFVLPIGVVYHVIQRVYTPAFRQLKRIESVTSSPIFSHFQESIQGVSTIRAYNLQKSFTERSQERLDNNFVAVNANASAFFCLSVRLQFLANLIVLGAALFTVSTPGISGGLAGLAITWAFQATGTMLHLINGIAELDKHIVSVERVKEYTDKETEDDWVQEGHRPEPGWPKLGHVCFNNYKTRYREELDLVLHGITCEIKGGERVGIVGRTGAGKSSLTVALFRIIEAAEGSISIDGENIADMGLHDLRSNLTILPQDPVLFAGTLKMNLDPFSKCTEDQLWEVLEHAHLKKYVEKLPDKLEHECGEGGQNLSVGQRQLVCLARTLLRKTKVLVLDEATAAVDMATDDLIQQTIREEFKDTTILTIAHRLKTVMDYDKIMVLEQGLIKEFDSPKALLQDSSSTFYSMAHASGLQLQTNIEVFRNKKGSEKMTIAIEPPEVNTHCI